MKCSMCNAEAAPDATFCAQCGTRLSPAGAGNKPTTSADSAALGAGQSPSSSGSVGRGRTTDVPEEILWEGTFSPKAMLGEGVGAALLSLVLLVGAFGFASNNYLRLGALGFIALVWLYLAMRLFTRRIGVHYKLTNQMFYHQNGILTRTTDRVELIEIHDVTWTQGLVDRMVNVGTIRIDSSDRTHHDLKLPGIEDVEDVAKKIDKARRGEQVRRGRRIESIGVQDGG